MEGKRHDSAMLAQYDILNELQQCSFNTQGDVLCIYGDPAYPLRPQLQGPFKGAVITEQQQQWIKSVYMSQVRIAVEWLFGDIVNYFKFLDFKKNLKAWKSTVVPICMAHQLQNILALTHPLLYKSIIISCKYIKQINVQNKFFLKQYIDNIYSSKN